MERRSRGGQKEGIRGGQVGVVEMDREREVHMLAYIEFEIEI